MGVRTEELWDNNDRRWTYLQWKIGLICLTQTSGIVWDFLSDNPLAIKCGNGKSPTNERCSIATVDFWMVILAVLMLANGRVLDLGILQRWHCRLSAWWFGTFYIFPYIGNNHPNWLIFFRGVQTTNQLWFTKNAISNVGSLAAF